MKKIDSSFVLIYIKGGKNIRLNNESDISEGLLSEYPNAVKAELYYIESGEVKLIHTIYGN